MLYFCVRNFLTQNDTIAPYLPTESLGTLEEAQLNHQKHSNDLHQTQPVP